MTDTPAIAIRPATDDDLVVIPDGFISVDDGPLATEFYGNLVALVDEYGTATVLSGLDKEKIEQFVAAALEIFPRRYLEHGMRVCHRCGYNEPNHKQLEARGAVSGPPYTAGCCGDFLPTPEHLRF